MVNRDQVVFRLLFGSNSDNTPGKSFSGFAFDDIYFGEKIKNVMVEFFTNSGITYDSYLDDLFNTENALKDTADFFKVEYHLDKPNSNDPISQANKDEQDARALRFGIPQANGAIMDGILGNYYGVNLDGKTVSRISPRTLNQRALEDPFFDIDLVELPTISDDSVAIQVTYTYVDPRDSLMNVAFNAMMIEGESNGFTYVFRKFLLGIEGQPAKQVWTQNDSRTFTRREIINVPIGTADDLYLVAFVENLDTKWVLQSLMRKMSTKSGTTIVSVDNPALAQLQQLSIFPNPASNTIHFGLENQLAGDYQWSIVDQRGIVVLEGGLNNDLTTPQQVSVRDLANGMYFIIMSEGGRKLFSRKIAVMNRN
jgi:hypothetical protein